MNPRLNTIIKNTAFLYVRMLIIMAISLYTSRVLLKMLGVDDFGIYSVVGSITAIFASLRTIFSEATQRFLNFAKGQNDTQKVQTIFSMSVFLHFVIGVLFVSVVLIIGEYLLCYKLNIPSERFLAAKETLYFSVLSIFLLILTIPYDAVIIANEKISVFALVSIIDSVLKLCIVFITPFLSYDRLPVYSCLLCSVSLFTLVVYYVYTLRFEECRIRFIVDKQILKELGAFSFWNFIGNMIFSIVHEGYNMLLNIFGSVVSNAARSIAYQVRAAVGQFSNNALVAVKPFVMQETAVVDKIRVFSYINKVLSVTYYLSLLITVPLVSYTNELLSLWLGEAPAGTSLFTQLTVIALLIRSLHGPLSLMFVSFGKIKRVTLFESSIYIISFFIAYVILKSGCPLWSIFAVLCVVELIIIVGISIIASYELKYDVLIFGTIIFKLFILSMACAFIIIAVKSFINSFIVGLFVVELLTAIMILVFSSRTEKALVKEITKKIGKK